MSLISFIFPKPTFPPPFSFHPLLHLLLHPHLIPTSSPSSSDGARSHFEPFVKDCVPLRASERVRRAAGWGLCTQPGPRVSAQLALLLSEMTRTTSADKRVKPRPPAGLPATPLRHIGERSVCRPAEAHYNQERQVSVWVVEVKNPSFKLAGNALRHRPLSSLVIFVICDEQ